VVRETAGGRMGALILGLPQGRLVLGSLLPA
jgi:hypothetical protein